MPLILVVEQEQRYVERISEALSSHGWDVEGVHDRTAALAFAAEQSAAVVVVNSEVQDSRDLIQSFSRHAGGPGTVVLIPENAADGASELGADEVLQKPFTDQDIRQAVRRCLIGVPDIVTTEAAAERSPTPEPAITDIPPTNEGFAVEEGQQLTSADIFGDVVQELEDALAAGTLGEAAMPAPAPALEIPLVEEPVVEEPVVEEPEVDERLEIEEPAEEEIELVPRVEKVEAARQEVEVQEAAEEEVAEELVVAEPPAAPRIDPAALLDARIHEAAEEGKRLAASSPGPASSSETVVSTDDLMRRALAGIDISDQSVGDMTTEATAEEIDRLVSSVVVSRDAAAHRQPPAVDGAEHGGAEEPGVDGLEGHQPEPDVPVEAAVLEVVEGVGSEEGAYQTRRKLLWAMIIIGVLGLLALFFMRSAGKSATPSSGVQDGVIGTPATTQQNARSGGDAATESGAGEAAAESVAAEDGLRRELDAQRRQLQEEIAKSQSSSENDDGP